MKNENPYIPKKAIVVKTERQTEDSILIRVDAKENATPGQFMELSLLNIGEAAFSIASYSEDYVEFLVRSVGNVSSALGGLRSGDCLLLRGPYGRGYPMEELAGGDVVAVAGGSGLASIRPVLEFMRKERKRFGRVDVFLGFRNPDEILFRKDIKAWERCFKVHLAIDKPSPGWSGEVGFIHAIVEKSELTGKDATAVICGPPIMIKFVVAALKGKGFSDEKIFVSLERRMQCGIGKCGHCMIKEKYVCKDGPVFPYKEAMNLEE
jgi:anaerobic sulfite reductase subunit B